METLIIIAWSLIASGFTFCLGVMLWCFMAWKAEEQRHGPR